MNVSVEVIAELFRQGAFVSALVAGFSFTFLAIILTSSSKKRVCDWTAGFAAAATAGLIVCALGWTFGVPRLLAMQANTSGAATFKLPPADMRLLHRSLSITFLACFFMFLTSLGLSGWIRSTRLGVVSACIAAIAAGYAIWLMHFFVS
jgi:hypothetical protein